MNCFIKLLVIGFLLWDQNNVASGQNNSATKNDSSQSDQQTSTTIASMEVPPPANNSNAVTPTLTPTVSSNISNTTGTQAPTVPTTMDLTSAFTATKGPTSSDFHLSTSPETIPTMTVSPTATRGKSENCSAIKINKPSYINKMENLTLDNVTIDSLVCDNITSPFADYSFTLGKYVFNVSHCEPTTIKCQTAECPNVILALNAPPDKVNYSLNTSAEKNHSIFNWTPKNKCIENISSICTDEENKSFSGNEIVNLKPYSNYTCNSSIIYNGSVISTKSVNITTKIAEPEIVQNLTCNATNKTITCTWDRPKTTNGPLDKYEIEINSTKSSTNKDVLTYEFKGLIPYTNYSITVKACNKGEKVEQLCGVVANFHKQTEPGVPSVVGGVKAVNDPKYNNAINISCREPKSINGIKKKYVLTLDDGTIKEDQNNCKFYIYGLSYLTTYKYKIYLENHALKGDVTEGEFTTRYNDKALIGFLAFLIAITSLALIIVLIKIYKLQKKSASNNEDSIPLTNPDDEKQLLNIEPIAVEQLLESYKRKNADEGRLFLDEFQSIPRVFSKFPIKEARKPCNQVKNRYIDILPYDENRVVLSEIHGEPGSDYINASYINGFKEPRKYIAAQGPKEETMTDFWRMIWEQKSTIIVMVTRCEEGNRIKCAQYWLSAIGETEEYEDIVVKMTEQKLFPDYITRKLHVTHKREKSERDITHIQFTVWPDHGVPDDPNLLLKLRRRVNALNNFFSGPIIVHCSAGVGRTGTYISIDAMLEGLEAEGRVDVYGYVAQLRRQRCLMVQVEFQYIFIHKALVEYNQFGETEISIAELPLILNNLKMKDPPEPSQLMCEFQRLPSYRNWRPQTTGNHQDNKYKNRFSSIVPYEFNRVQIKTEEDPEQEVTEDSEMSSDDDSDSEDYIYINGSYLIGYWGTREIVATQAPLTNTLSEFWQMIFQKKAKAIVMLSAPNQENNEKNCAPYWKEKSKTYDDLQVELTSEKSYGSYTERCFEIKHVKRTDVRKVFQFHYEQWEEALPTETKELLDMITKIKKIIPTKRKDEQTRHDKHVPLIVHCSDGSQLTGTFSALWCLLESANVEGFIDVFQTVKNLRRQRPGFVSSFEQYQFLYDTLASTVPAQNGQIKSSNNQEDKLEIQNEFESKVPEVKSAPSSTGLPGEETSSKPKEDDTTANGPSPAAFTDVTLRIEE